MEIEFLSLEKTGIRSVYAAGALITNIFLV